MQTPEKNEVTLGYMPLLDCAAFIIASEKGFYHEQGVKVTLQQEPSWANIRDKVAFGLFDGAQMLAAMPVAMTLGASPLKVPMVTGLSMGLNGNAITCSNALYKALLGLSDDLHASPLHSSTALHALVEKRKADGMAPLVIAHVYNYSSHNYLLRYWLASSGINPDEDVRLIVVPPQMMAKRMAAGEIDAFCVGEPWNTLAIEQGIGRVLISGAEIWNRAPEKVLGVTSEWAQENPNTHLALIKALLKALHWLDQAENSREAADILSRTNTLPMSGEQIRRSMTGAVLAEKLTSINANEISIGFKHNANKPLQTHAVWCIEQMYRWGYLDVAMDIQNAATEIYKPELFEQAWRELELSSGEHDSKARTMDEHVYASSHTEAVLQLQNRTIKNSKVDMAFLAGLNKR